MRKLLLCFPLLLCMGCGFTFVPGNEEVWDTTYTVTARWYEDYPSLRPRIKQAMEDGVLTYYEWDSIRLYKEEINPPPKKKNPLQIVIDNDNS